MPFKHHNYYNIFISGDHFLCSHVNIEFGTVLVLMLYVLNIRIIMKIWYTVKNSTERAFQYIDKHGQTIIGMPILEI